MGKRPRAQGGVGWGLLGWVGCGRVGWDMMGWSRVGLVGCGVGDRINFDAWFLKDSDR